MAKELDKNTVPRETKVKKKPKKSQKKVNSKLTENKRNVTWQANQKLLQEAYINLLKDLKRCPTRREISEAVDLSETTIQKHIVEMKFEPIAHPMRVLTNDVIASIYNSSRKGSAQSQKLWMQIMEGWSEKSTIEMPGIEDAIRGMTAQSRKARIAALKEKVK